MMKQLKSSVILLILIPLLMPQCLRAQDFNLVLLKTDGEKSKDSWSSDTRIEINNLNVTYSVTYSGSIKRFRKDLSKSCDFTQENLDQIKSIIKERSLNVDDSLFQKDEKYKSYERFVNISLKIDSEGKSSAVRINGDVSLFEDKLLYNNVSYLVSFLTELIENC